MFDVKLGIFYFGWFSNDVEGEFSFVEIVFCYGVYVFVVDWFSNLIVFLGIELKFKLVKKVLCF